MEGVNEDSNIHLQFQLFVILDLIFGVERRLENVETPLASQSHTEYLLSTKLINVNILEVIICLLLCYTSWIITSLCIETYFKDNITFIAHLCNNVRSYRYDFDIENVRIYVYCNVMPANGALQPKYLAETGTCKTYPYNCVTYLVFMCTW